jgi:hypothetical protein
MHNTLMRLIYTLLIIVGTAMIAIPMASAATYDVRDIQISIQSDNAVKARDQAIIRAQRVAFAQIVGQEEKMITHVTDSQISRLVRDFSLRGERFASKSYKAIFIVRFDPARIQNFAMSNGFTLVDPSQMSPVVVSENNSLDQNVIPDTAISAPVLQTIIILPILDIGSRRVVWDEPNPWRDVWQRKDHSTSRLKVVLPLSDAQDVMDIPDASFLTSKNDAVKIDDFLQRYSASILYIIVAKNQGAALDPSGGMALSLYRHDGNKLKFIRKNVIRSRPGYLFDDAVPAGMQMILKNQSGQDQTTPQPQQELNNLADRQPVNTPSMPVTNQYNEQGNFTITVPYQTLAQWVKIQQKIRRVAGIKAIVPIRVSPSSAQINVITSINKNDLIQNLSWQGFLLQEMPNGEMVLVEK